MLNKTLLNNAAQFENWRKNCLDGERHFNVVKPKSYPCTVVWKNSPPYGLDYMYVYQAEPTTGRILYGRAATDSDAVDIAAWLEQSGYGVKIWRDNFEVSYMDHRLKEQLGDLPAEDRKCPECGSENYFDHEDGSYECEDCDTIFCDAEI